MDAGSSIEKRIVWDCHYLHFWVGWYPAGPIQHRHLALRYSRGEISLWIRDEEEVPDFPRTPLDHGKMCSASLFQADLVPKTPGVGEYPPKGTHGGGAGEGMLPERPGWSLWGCWVPGHGHCGVSEQEITLNVGGKCKAKAGVVVGNKW